MAGELIVLAKGAEEFDDTGYLEKAYDMGVDGVKMIDARIDELSGLSKYGLTEGMVWAVIAITLIVSSRALTQPIVAQGVRERKQRADREDHLFRKEHGLWPYTTPDVASRMKADPEAE